MIKMHYSIDCVFQGSSHYNTQNLKSGDTQSCCYQGGNLRARSSNVIRYSTNTNMFIRGQSSAGKYDSPRLSEIDIFWHD